jgi:dephospho-CoA kinase
MLIIGLTGGIGSGKSTVAKVFAQLGVPILNADLLAKSIMNTDEIIRNEIIKAFGENAYENNQLNSAYVANIVFKDPFQLAVLNAIVHPATIRESMLWAAKQSTPYVIKEAALFFESGSAEGLDGIIGVTAPNALRIKRVMERDGITRESVIQRMDQQIDQTLKMKLCDWVINNNEQELLIPQIMQIYDVIMQHNLRK